MIGAQVTLPTFTIIAAAAAIIIIISQPERKHFAIFFFLYWSTVDLQCCAKLCCAKKWLGYTHIYLQSF